MKALTSDRYEVFYRKTGEDVPTQHFVGKFPKIDDARVTRERWWASVQDVADVWIIDLATGKRVS